MQFRKSGWRSGFGSFVSQCHFSDDQFSGIGKQGIELVRRQTFGPNGVLVAQNKVLAKLAIFVLSHSENSG